MPGVKEGDIIPYFELPNQNGELIKIKEFIGNPMVIYFYPKDNTYGCTKEACSFRDFYADFNDLDCEVFGISSDSISTHKEFEEKHNLPFHLLSDKNGLVRNQFGVPSNLLGLIPGRVTYVVNKEGLVVKIFNSQYSVHQHVKEALETLNSKTN